MLDILTNRKAHDMTLYSCSLISRSLISLEDLKKKTVI